MTELINQLHVYEISDGNSDFVVAESEQEAIGIMAEWAGGTRADFEHYDCEQWPDDKPFTIQNAYDDSKPHTKICAEWATENGKGYLAGEIF